MINTYQKTGQYHTDNGQMTQDAVGRFSSNDFSVFALADGATACANSRAGAEIACEVVGKYALEAGEDLFRFEGRKTAFLIIEQVLYHLKAETELSKMPLSSYASTLLLCIVKRSTGDAFVINLGDGAMFQADENICRLVMAPIRYGEHACCLTTTREAYKSVHIKRIHLGSDTIFLCSDGVYNLMRERTWEKIIKAAVVANDFDCLSERLNMATIADDASFILGKCD